MKIVIIEDEKLSADYLITLLKKIDFSIEIIVVIESVKDAILFFNDESKVDLIFSDIQLSDGVSFDIFSKVKIEIPIIFTTAYDEYAIKAFKLNSIDYLLKPLGLDEVRNSIEKYKRWNPNLSNNISDFSSKYLIDNRSYKNRFIVKLGDTISSIQTDEISHFIAEDGIVLLVLENGKRFPIDYSLDNLDLNLNPQEFFRINRKVIVKLNYIQKVSSYFNSRLKIQANFIDEESRIVSRDRVGDFKKWLDGNIE